MKVVNGVPVWSTIESASLTAATKTFAEPTAPKVLVCGISIMTFDCVFADVSTGILQLGINQESPPMELHKIVGASSTQGVTFTILS